MNKITRQVVVEAFKYMGHREFTRNSSAIIDVWLRRVRARPGDPWCAAFASCMVVDACHELGMASRFRGSASGHRLFELGREDGLWTPEPGPGFIFGIDHGKRKSHVGIVVEVDEHEVCTTIEGNTNRAGEREGTCVASHRRPLATLTMGFLDPGKLFA